jgi:hypothetical protein
MDYRRSYRYTILQSLKAVLILRPNLGKEENRILHKDSKACQIGTIKSLRHGSEDIQYPAQLLALGLAHRLAIIPTNIIRYKSSGLQD